ncbi:N-acetylglucosamine-binding protein GbpA [Pseudomonas sp. TTU2014-080ASC]|uniref:N-acetylglucosamine-binding protein GbpA n=1 Tax=Pseudomonas sp. TTU2014-080ASC TaxID=1729724 RepID=UPI0007184E4E|nr:N-acetylglucosamine-binding protein GbpA [Pseudomonas sp. TTU2014-080ASC]KRW59401.1 multidrug transporter [Pseudomonas sp. TTU2014-080ASC]
MLNATHAKSFLKLPMVLAISAAALTCQQASAHGFVESPKSRSFMCHSEGGQANTNCGPVEYEPQSVEYIGRPDGSLSHFPSNSQACTGDFTKCGPADGTIPAGGLPQFSALNEQTATRWAKNVVKPGPLDITWLYRAAHSTRYWQFYITKKDWNPNQPLTRDSFELKPLLDEPWPSLNAPVESGQRTHHKLNIPADRSGYHVLLATWKVHDTDATFYQVIDLDIKNDSVAPSTWTNVGSVQPEALSIGDKVKTRVFNAKNEDQTKQITLDISNADLAKADIWPFELARKVNAANKGYLMGLVNSQDQVVPNYGINDIVVKKGSNITNVIIEKQQAAKPGELSISGLQPEYLIKNGQADIHFTAIAKGGEYTIKATVFNKNNEAVAYQQAPAGNSPHFSMAIKGQQPGDFDLTVVATGKNDEVLQQSQRFKLKEETNTGGNTGGGNGGSTSEYDHVFPEGLSSYIAGTVVLQPKDGQRYQCKPFPYSGYCVQWKEGANAFEPGVGHSWDMAWERK